MSNIGRGYGLVHVACRDVYEVNGDEDHAERANGQDEEVFLGAIGKEEAGETGEEEGAESECSQRNCGSGTSMERPVQRSCEGGVRC
jgi:hypothetical protein